MLHWLILLPRRLKELLFLSLSLCYPDGWFLGGKFGFDSIIISNGTQFLMNLINWFSFTDYIKYGFSIPPLFFHGSIAYTYGFMIDFCIFYVDWIPFSGSSGALA